jgi:phage tail sheath protein FI
MPEYLSPGVYVEEVDTGNKPIEGVATSTVGFLGVTERGPVDPTLITSFGDYTRSFGSYVTDRYLTFAVEGFFQNGGKRCFISRIVSGDAATAPSTLAIGNMTVTAIGPGVWGDRIAVKVSGAGLHDANLFKLTVMYWRPGIDVPTQAGNPPHLLIDPTHPGSRTPANLPNRREPTLIEVYDNLSANPNTSSFYERVVNGQSNLVTLQHTGPARPPNNAAENTQPLVQGQIPFLQNGDDGADLVLADGQRSLTAFEAVDEIAILCCPDEHAAEFDGIADDVVQQCENLMDRCAIIQAPQNPPAVANHFPSVPSKYAAYYYPWLNIRNPLNGTELLIPPGGHVAGIYARSDTERGVHKAPANEIIRGLYLDPLDPLSGLQRQVTKGEQDILNPRGVNVLRWFQGRGNLVWGARTTTTDPDWKYVNVRRLFIFVEESIGKATQWVVFEPNDEPLWARVRRSVSDFLTRLWMDGMLQGSKKEEAYFVRCDRTTMTQADIDNGRLIMLIGIAPVKPAEFVIFRIGQWTGGSDVTEG